MIVLPAVGVRNSEVGAPLIPSGLKLCVEDLPTVCTFIILIDCYTTG
jgi:hypothetical protein